MPPSSKTLQMTRRNAVGALAGFLLLSRVRPVKIISCGEPHSSDHVHTRCLYFWPRLLHPTHAWFPSECLVTSFPRHLFPGSSFICHVGTLEASVWFPERNLAKVWKGGGRKKERKERKKERKEQQIDDWNINHWNAAVDIYQPTSFKDEKCIRGLRECGLNLSTRKIIL